jgi:phosphoribosylanthranilate isomerase
MRAHDNIAALSDLAPDYMGFIFWKHSKRFVTTSTPHLPATIKKTGVFVDANPAIHHSHGKAAPTPSPSTPRR